MAKTTKPASKSKKPDPARNAALLMAGAKANQQRKKNARAQGIGQALAGKMC